ncbi:sensor histidine kinase [Chitinimonas arctica]|nr:histidine kinase [Chitinimonas arctica]
MNPTPAPPTIDRWHPLELFPWFRQWPNSPLRNLLYTFIWNMGLGSVMAMVSLLSGRVDKLAVFLWQSFVLTNTIGYSIHLLFDLGRWLVGAWLQSAPRWVRKSYHIGIPILGVFIGYGLGFSILDLQGALRWLFSATGALSVAVLSVLTAGVLLGVFILHERQSRADAALAAARQQASDADRRALEAQLRMLQAQIEPHFLYNTLANAVGLIGPSPDKARLLLEHLIAYLRTSLDSSRAARTELGIELESLRAYLGLMAIRMGPRLTYRIECDPALQQVPLPPMLLQPLVENAIQHGLEPCVEGGEIRIEARREGPTLHIVVYDTGRGFDPLAKPRAGGGVGLANLRDRLNSLYGGAALLTIADHPPRGVKVSLRLPLETDN